MASGIRAASIKHKFPTNSIGVVKREKYQSQIEKVSRCLSYISMTVFIFNESSRIIEEAQEAIPSCLPLACLCEILTGWDHCGCTR